MWPLKVSQRVAVDHTHGPGGIGRGGGARGKKRVGGQGRWGV